MPRRSGYNEEKQGRAEMNNEKLWDQRLQIQTVGRIHRLLLAARKA